MRVNLTDNKIRKIPSLVDFHSLNQLLHSQVYRNDLKLKLKFVLINEGEPNRKSPKIFAGKNLQIKQKKLHALI